MRFWFGNMKNIKNLCVKEKWVDGSDRLLNPGMEIRRKGSVTFAGKFYNHHGIYIGG